MKKRLSATILRGTFAVFLCVAGPLAARQNDQSAAPDNTKVNQQDRAQSAVTADQSKNDASDREMAAHIRRDVTKDKSLSTYGHNVKIVAEHGKVTLKGPVHSDDEKRAIEEHARKYAGDGNVDSQLTVKNK